MIVVLWAFLGFACSPAPDRESDSPAAARAAREFLAAVHDGNCELAWTFLSAGTQRYVEMKSREMIEDQPYYADPFAPKHLYCKPTSVHRFLQYVPESAQVKVQGGERAIVSVEKRTPAGFLLPGFWSTRTESSMTEMRLIEEGGRWKVELP